MSAPRVLFVASVARHLVAFHLPDMELLRGQGYEIHAACDAKGLTEELEGRGVRVWHVPISRSPWSPRNAAAFVRLLRLLRTGEYRLVHVHTPVAAVLTRVAARIARTPAVLYTAHGFHFFRGAPLRNWLLYFPLERALARWTDGLIVVNDEDWRHARHWPVRGRVHSVPGVGVPLDTVPEVATNGDAAAVLGSVGATLPPVALMVCELSPTKNVEMALRAWRYVKAARPDVLLVIAGEGSQRGRLERLAGRLGVADRVRFLGFRRDVPTLMSLATLLVATAKHEGLPRVVLEAMAAGKPVVATNVRGQSDLVEDGRNGFLVPLDAPRQLARGILRVLGDAGLAVALGAEGKRRSVAYGIPIVSRTMSDIYNAYLPEPWAVSAK